MTSVSFIQNAVSDFRRIVKNELNKPGRRSLLCLIASLYSLPKTHKLMKVYYNEGAWVHKCSDGVIVDRRINYDSSLHGYSLTAKDNWEFIYKLKPGDVVFDIGAGVGSDTYYFSKAVGPNGKVISVEAHPQTFLCLKKFCQFNALDNVILENFAISDDESEAIITDDEKHISSTILNTNQSGIRIKSISIDLLAEKHDISAIDFIKMNIEGAEKKAIRGMKNSIKITKCVCISCHDFKAYRDGMEEMRSKEIVQEFLSENVFVTVLRKTDERPWIRDQLNAINKNIFYQAVRKV